MRSSSTFQPPDRRRLWRPHVFGGFSAAAKISVDSHIRRLLGSLVLKKVLSDVKTILVDFQEMKWKTSNKNPVTIGYFDCFGIPSGRACIIYIW